MRKIAVIGAGKIGSAIVDMLLASGAYQVAVVDRDQGRLEALRLGAGVDRICVDVSDPKALAESLRGVFAVISAAPYQLTVPIAQAVKAAGAHYLDLTEDVASTREVRALAQDAAGAFIPQCGLAPGFISIVASDLARGFDELHEVRLRVGALPRYPTNGLNYNLTWSTEGVINEYCEPCEAIVQGRRQEVAALEGLEEFALDGVTYEAFNTSGGLGSLCETLAGKVRNLNYRTIRYPGHAAIMRTLLDDLGLRRRRDLLKDILEHAVPTTMQDVVIVFVTVSGMKSGALMQDTYLNRIYAQPVAGTLKSAIQITTAASVCAVADMLAQGDLPQQGFLRQEDIPLDRFLANPFGRWYAGSDQALRTA
ncbi:MAG: saccharopine dehydrogenase NADP-binding domain-containing protein [Phenylobacterium sp.]|uniref:saccharopine dehydrogenase family protein n=1 Tax=Phenylobacterium sp. TaxID=1871053 RepID=UPI0027293E16|nr:saccharopine dehydrogenase C-terminal domain-containing protein [Phenylobacterium sp.]MDO8900653.1 saccharopine dehydrogenase NADP-binding domain-containing protein [Phenylobacterium sp.]